METNDFLGSFAQENVSFSTQIIRTASVGENYWTVMIFIENDRFVTVDESWEEAPGLASCKVLVVQADTYSKYVHADSLLASWLYDLFANGFMGNCILAAPAAKVTTPAASDAFVTALNTAYEVLKPYAYHVTVCAGGDNTVSPHYAKALSAKCKANEYLSGAPMLPVTNTTLNSDPLYSALHTDNLDSFMGWHSDTTRNLALYSLGIALATYNGSNTPVGSGLDMTASSNITASGVGGTNPTTPIKDSLKNAHVQYMKTVGNNTGAVAAEVDKTINGRVYAAYWIVAYITYMSKVRIAEKLTQPNFYKNASNYDDIVGVLSDLLNKFSGAGLKDINISAPSFDELPESADDEIIIPNAWSATYENHVRKVTISGSLYIGA